VLRIKYERKTRGFTQDVVDVLAFVHQPQLSLIENGRLRPTQAQLQRLAKALRVSPPEVLLRPVEIVEPRS
jgi:transcriptional regulator with XRE-family HTH domain